MLYHFIINGVSGAKIVFEEGKYEGDFSFRVEEGEEPVLGVRKTGKITNDWTCFDNFKLLYVSKPTAIREVTGSAAVPVDVYTVSGVKVRSAVMPHEAVNGLPRGIYIVGTRKFAIK